MSRTLRFAPALLGALLVAAPAAAEFEWSLEADAGIQGRWFYADSESPNADESFSLSLEPELLAEWNRGAHRIVFTPFGRWDSEDDERSHADIRELYYEAAIGRFEVRAGLSRVFWGKTELLHLVDVINQDDGVENLDGEDKLGQPMLRLNWISNAGSLQLYALPLFRERTFPGPDGRLGPTPAVDTDEARYEHADEDEHFDWAVRFAGYLGPLDYGIAHFSGTHRDPQIVTEFLEPPSQDPNAPPPAFRLVPFYGQVDQTSIDAQLTLGGWLLKLEALYRDQSVLASNPQNPQEQFIDTLHYTAATGGFEYSFYGVFGSALDLGVLAEYLYDERGDEAGHGFEDDVFVAARLAANDVNDTAVLAGAVIDLDEDTVFLNVEASRRIGGSSKLSLELRAFVDVPDDDPLAAVRDDDHLQLEYSYFF